LNYILELWDVDFDFDSHGGRNQKFRFSVGLDQDNCLELYVYEYFTSKAEIVTFDLPVTYCALDLETFFIIHFR